jgi:hypothetical protein
MNVRTLTRSAPSPLASDNGSAPAEAKPRRRLPASVVGVGLAVASLGVFVYLTPQAVRSSRVLVVAHPVAPGAVVGLRDLKIVALSVPKGLEVVPATQEATVIGEVARAELVPGSLLAPGELGPSSAAPSLVGVALKAGQYPPGLAPGQRVEVVVTPPVGGASTAGPTPGAVLSPAAVVESVVPSTSDPGAVTVGLGVSGSEALAITQAGATGQVALVAQQ